MTQILKANQVNTAGEVKLNLNAQTASHTPNTTANGTNTIAIPTARIVETTEQYAVVEVTCQCGQINLVKCDF